VSDKPLKNGMCLSRDTFGWSIDGGSIINLCEGGITSILGITKVPNKLYIRVVNRKAKVGGDA